MCLNRGLHPAQSTVLLFVMKRVGSFPAGSAIMHWEVPLTHNMAKHMEVEVLTLLYLQFGCWLYSQWVMLNFAYMEMIHSNTKLKLS